MPRHVQDHCAHPANSLGKDDTRATTQDAPKCDQSHPPSHCWQFRVPPPPSSGMGFPMLDTLPFLALRNDDPCHRSSFAFSDTHISLQYLISVDCTVSATWGSVPRGARKWKRKKIFISRTVGRRGRSIIIVPSVICTEFFKCYGIAHCE